MNLQGSQSLIEDFDPVEKQLLFFAQVQCYLRWSVTLNEPAFRTGPGFWNSSAASLLAIRKRKLAIHAIIMTPVNLIVAHQLPPRGKIRVLSITVVGSKTLRVSRLSAGRFSSLPYFLNFECAILIIIIIIS